ncbi:helix-turn-helix domain-containing protein [Actinomadura sp. B10D3]|uniref:MarR family transcriptional regulator n=1 Tax=Actinomadura sp. B10D3 TaxID=3153557 RepID=UPI00325DB186
MTAIEIHGAPTAAMTDENTTPAEQDGGRPDGAAGDVWDALLANPGASPAELSATAGVSRATTNRTLAALEKDGHRGPDTGRA